MKEMAKEISFLKQKINHLELNLEQAELTVAKTFPNVRFKNYKDRKRILVITSRVNFLLIFCKT